MRILVCPTEFKGTLPARRAARAMAAGARRARPAASIDALPLSDGGPGLLDSLVAAAGPGPGPTSVRFPVADPLGREVEGRILLLPSVPSGQARGQGGGRDDPVAVAESADACGLHLLHPAERRPTRTGTGGVGDLIREAASRGARQLFLGLGGSATCDGGAGAAARLGWRFLDAGGEPLGRGGGELERLDRAEAPDGEVEAELTVLADVRNPLLGPEGAARTFGPQKGASPDDVRCLEQGLARLASLSPRPELREEPGAGAAGGLAFGCAAFLGASIVDGAPWVLERVDFAGRLARADLVVTGEGAFDRTTGMGKLVGRVLGRAREKAVPAVLVCGRLVEDPPEGVWAADGGGAELDAAALADLTEDLVGRATGNP